MTTVVGKRPDGPGDLLGSEADSSGVYQR